MKKAKSRSYRLASFSFFFAVIIISIGIIDEITIGDHTLKFRLIDPLLALAFIGPAFGLYGFRRWSDSKYLKKDSG